MRMCAVQPKTHRTSIHVQASTFEIVPVCATTSAASAFACEQNLFAPLVHAANIVVGCSKLNRMLGGYSLWYYTYVWVHKLVAKRIRTADCIDHKCTICAHFISDLHWNVSIADSLCDYISSLENHTIGKKNTHTKWALAFSGYAFWLLSDNEIWLNLVKCECGNCVRKTSKMSYYIIIWKIKINNIKDWHIWHRSAISESYTHHTIDRKLTAEDMNMLSSFVLCREYMCRSY